MDEETLRVVRRRLNARNLPYKISSEPIRVKGDEFALFTLGPDGGSLWLGDELQSRDQLNHLLDYLELAWESVVELRDDP